MRPLQEGYRLCLVYNLTLAKSKKAIQAPRNMEHVDTLKQILRDWQTHPGEDSPRKLAILLEHQYSKEGLAWDALKGVDRARARAVREAARQAGCHAYLALLTFWESGSAVDTGGGSGYYGRRRRYYEDDDDDSSGHEMEEVFESSLTAEHWTDDDGNPLQLGPVTVDHQEVVPEESLTAVEPEEDFEGYTGNEGMTLERWYRHAAIFLWPENRHFEVLCSCATQNPVAALGLLVKKWQSTGHREGAELKEQCMDFARHIITHWRPAPDYGRFGQKSEPCELVPALVRLDEAILIQSFLSQVMTRDAAVEMTASLLKRCEKHGWSAFQDAFVSLFNKATAGCYREMSGSWSRSALANGKGRRSGSRCAVPLPGTRCRPSKRLIRRRKIGEQVHWIVRQSLPVWCGR